MESKDKSDDEPGQTTAPPPARRRRRKQKSAPSDGTESRTGKPPDQAPGFSDGSKILEAAGLGLSGRFEEIRSAPKTDGYFQFVDHCFDILVDLKPEIRDVITRAEWQHIHALLFYNRTANIEFTYYGKKQAPPVRIPIPYDVRIFQPIWAILSNIGVVEDDVLRARHVPLCDMPTTQGQTSAEDLGSILSCTQYDWKTSWTAVEADRATLKARRNQAGKHDRSWSQNIQTLDLRQLGAEVVSILADLKSLSGLAAADFDSDHYTLTSPYCTWTEAGSVKVTWHTHFDVTCAAPGECNDLFTEVATWIRTEKAKALVRQTTQPKTTTLQFTFQGETVPNDPGRYGEWLGWDPQLWSMYREVCDILRPVSMWSLSFPKEINGTYMWVIPREQDASGFFVRLPKTNIPTPIWMLALILDMCTLDSHRTFTNYVETDRAMSLFAVTNAYIKAATKSGLPTETFR